LAQPEFAPVDTGASAVPHMKWCCGTVPFDETSAAGDVRSSPVE